MSGEALRWLLGIVLIAHGVGHVLFMPALHEVLRLQNDGRSWLVTPVLGDGITSMLASIAAGITAVAFVAAGVGIIVQAPWWRMIAIGASMVSIGVVIVMWSGVPTSSAVFALAFDVAVLVALVVMHWPSTETLGA